jgi:hypothetical protein
MRTPLHHFPHHIDTGGRGLGGHLLSPDWRDNKLIHVPSVSRLLDQPEEIPEAFSLREYVRGWTDQGHWPACVAASSGAVQSIYESIERGQWFNMDWLGMYRQCGGDGKQGVDPRRVLKTMKQEGYPVQGTGAHYKISDYAFHRMVSPLDMDVVKAAIAAKRPCAGAMLLPPDFNAGDSAGTAVTGDYHALCFAGYDARRVYFLNSWGKEWGDEGWGSVPWEFLTRPEQAGYAYLFTTVDETDQPEALAPGLTLRQGCQAPVINLPHLTKAAAVVTADDGGEPEFAGVCELTIDYRQQRTTTRWY